MQREIKFRGWDVKTKVMVYDYAINDLSNGGIRIIDFHPRMSEQYHGQWELMQYTGLKDRNGKEIYEGDVYKPPIATQLFQIMFIAGAFCAGRSEKDAVPFGWEDEAIDTDWASEVEVIGNVYENPELLTNGS